MNTGRGNRANKFFFFLPHLWNWLEWNDVARDPQVDTVESPGVGVIGKLASPFTK